MGNPFELKMTYFVHFSNILYNSYFRWKYASFEALEFAQTLVFIDI